MSESRTYETGEGKTKITYEDPKDAENENQKIWKVIEKINRGNRGRK